MIGMMRMMSVLEVKMMSVLCVNTIGVEACASWAVPHTYHIHHLARNQDHPIGHLFDADGHVNLFLYSYSSLLPVRRGSLMSIECAFEYTLYHMEQFALVNFLVCTRKYVWSGKS
jgi:hypothetical protein